MQISTPSTRYYTVRLPRNQNISHFCFSFFPKQGDVIYRPHRFDQFSVLCKTVRFSAKSDLHRERRWVVLDGQVEDCNLETVFVQDATAPNAIIHLIGYIHSSNLIKSCGEIHCGGMRILAIVTQRQGSTQAGHVTDSSLNID